MRNNKLLWVTYTAVLIALIVLAQLLTRVIPAVMIGPFQASQLITGSLVNLVLLVGALVPGFGPAATAAVLSPVFAAFFGIIPGQLPQMIPVVMAGNLTIVFVVWLFNRASAGLFQAASVILNIIGVVAGAFFKSGIMWAGTVKVVLPFLHITGKKAEAVTSLVTAPQVVTALVGGLIALLLMPALGSFKKHRRF